MQAPQIPTDAGSDNFRELRERKAPLVVAGWNPRLTRRQVLGGGLAAAAGISLGPLVAACGPAASTKVRTSQLAPKVGRPNGRPLTVASLAYAETLDPMVSLDGQSPLLWRAAYEPLLVYRGDTTQYEPRLATGFEISPDGRTYTFQLRPGVQFHDGEPFNAAAAKLSIQRQIAVKQGMSYALTGLSSIETPGDYTLVVKTSSFSDAFISAFSSVYGVYMISPKAITDHKGSDWAQSWLSSHMVGTGPYVLDSYVPEESAHFSANPSYWRGWHQDQPQGISVVYLTDASTAELELTSGELDLVVWLPDNVVDSLESTPGARVETVPSLNLQYLGLNCQKGPTREKLVRQAIAYGFDYSTYVKVLNAKLPGARQADGPIPYRMTEYTPGLPQYSYQPDKAKALLAEAGFKGGGFTLPYLIETGYYWKVQMGQLFQKNMADLGIDVTIQTVSDSTWDGILGNPATAHHTFGVVWWPTLNTPYDYLWALFDTQAWGNKGYNYAYYSNPAFDATLQKAYTEPNQTERIKLYAAAERISIEDSPYLNVMYQPYQQPMSPSVRGYTVNGFYVYTFDWYALHLA